MPKTKFNYSKLRGRITEKYGCEARFAEAFGVSTNTLSRWLNNKSKISTDHMMKMSSSDMLDIPVNEIGTYFFTEKVQAN